MVLISRLNFLSKVHKKKAMQQAAQQSENDLDYSHRLGVKPYGCTICDKKFARSDHLANHLKVVKVVVVV